MTVGGALAGRVVIGSRRSRLARIQAGRVGEMLVAAHPGLRVEYRTVSTAGDRDRRTPLPEIGGKGLFTADLEAELAARGLDVVVHSLKDLPTEAEVDGSLAAIPERADPRDVLVLRPGLAGVETPEALPPGLRIGTSSSRRAAQIERRLPRVQIVPLRGNVGTRLGRVSSGDLDGIVIAAAGLERLGVRPPGAIHLDATVWPGAPGQGALAVQCRLDDDATRRLVAAIHDRDVGAAVGAERALLGRLGGGCHVPVGALATHDAGRLHLVAAVYPPDPRVPPLVDRADGPAEDAVPIGTSLAERLLAAGAEALLRPAGATDERSSPELPSEVPPPP